MEEDNVIITGDSRGIGKSITTTLINNGYNVYSIGRTKPDNHMNFIECDLSDVNKVKNLRDRINDIDARYLICNASVDRNGTFLTRTINDIDSVFTTNYTSHYILTQHFISNLISNNNPGKIIFITSIWGHRSTRERSLYSSSKFALEGLSKSLANEFIDDNILINCIAPSFTDINDTTPPDSKLYRTREHINSLQSKVHGNRLVQPREVAEAALWLLSDKCTYMTGQTLMIDRGDMI